MGTWIEHPRAWRSAPDDNGPGVLVLHPWWGLNATVLAACDQLAREGFLVLAPDLFGDGRVVTTVEDAERRVATADPEAVGERARGALRALREDPSRAGSAVGAIGYSFGAWWALTLARELSAPAAVVVYYGTGPGDGSADVLGHFAADDPFEPEAEVVRLETSLREAGRQVALHRYPGTRHWFAEPDRPEHDPAAAALAWERTLGFLRERLTSSG